MKMIQIMEDDIAQINIEENVHMTVNEEETHLKAKEEERDQVETEALIKGKETNQDLEAHHDQKKPVKARNTTLNQDQDPDLIVRRNNQMRRNRRGIRNNRRVEVGVRVIIGRNLIESYRKLKENNKSTMLKKN